MRTNDFTAEGINEQNPASVKALNFLLTPFYIVDDMLSYLGRVIRCALVAWLFETDMNSAGVLLWKYYQHVVWVTDDEEEGEAEVLDDGEGEQDESEPESYPPLSPEFTMPTLPVTVINDASNPKTEQAKSKNTVNDRALESLIDFTFAVFEEEGMIDREGVLLKGVVAPWARRGELSSPIKERIKIIIDQTDPRVFFINESKLWQFNLIEYANPESAKIAIIEACNSISNRDQPSS